MKYNTAIHDIMCTLCYSFIDCDFLLRFSATEVLTFEMDEAYRDTGSVTILLQA